MLEDNNGDPIGGITTTGAATMAASGLIGSIVLGQAVSLMDTISALCVKLLASKTDVQFPIFQYVITYFVVCVVAIIPYMIERRRQKMMKEREPLPTTSPILSAAGSFDCCTSPELELTPFSIPYGNNSAKLRPYTDRKSESEGFRVALQHPRMLTDNGLSIDVEMIQQSVGDESQIVSINNQNRCDGGEMPSWMVPPFAPIQSPPSSSSLYTTTAINNNAADMTTPMKPPLIADLIKGGCASDSSTTASDSTGRISTLTVETISGSGSSIDHHAINTNPSINIVVPSSPTSLQRGSSIPAVTTSPLTSSCHASSEWGENSMLSQSPEVEPKEGTEVGSTTTTAGLGTSASVSCSSMWSRGTSPAQSPMRSPVGYFESRNRNGTGYDDGMETARLGRDSTSTSDPMLRAVMLSQQRHRLHGNAAVHHSTPPSSPRTSHNRHPNSTQRDSNSLSSSLPPFSLPTSQPQQRTENNISRVVRARSAASSPSSLPSDDGRVLAVDSINHNKRLPGFPLSPFHHQQQSDVDHSRKRRGHSAIHRHHHHQSSTSSRTPSPEVIGSKHRHQRRGTERSASLCLFPEVLNSSNNTNNHDNDNGCNRSTARVDNLVTINDEENRTSASASSIPNISNINESRHHQSRRRSNSWNSSSSGSSSSSVGHVHRNPRQPQNGVVKGKKNGFQIIGEQRRGSHSSSSDEESVGHVHQHNRHHDRMHKPLKLSSSFESTDEDDDASFDRQDSTRHCLKKGSKDARTITSLHHHHTRKHLDRAPPPAKGVLNYLRYQRDRLSTWLWDVFTVGTPAFYILVAFLDVQGGTLTVVAFNYANLASCCLIDWISLLTAFVLSVKFMGEKATRSHVIALLVGLVGSLCILLSDSMSEVEVSSEAVASTAVVAAAAIASSLTTTEVPSISTSILNAISPSPLGSHLRQVSGSSLVAPAVALDQPYALPNGVMIEPFNLNTLELDGKSSVVRKESSADRFKETLFGSSHLDLYPLGERHQSKMAPSSTNGNSVSEAAPLRSLSDTNGTTNTEDESSIALNDGDEVSKPSARPHTPQQRVISREERLFGDIMCLLAATFLGIVTVMMEKALVVGVPSSELLFKTFFPSLIIALIEFFIFEAHKIPALIALPTVSWVYLISAALTMSGAYALAPVVLQRSSSAFFNLSLLTSAGLAVLFSAVLLGDPFPPLYSVGLVSILGSLIIYHNPNDIDGSK